MKPFSTFTLLKQPLELVWAAMRDDLPAIAAAMDDLEGVEVLERGLESDGRLRLVNRWTARRKVPAMLQSALGTGTISWLDTAVWDDAARVCEWRIEPALLAGKIECTGRTRYEPAMAGRGTRVTFEGNFQLQPGFLTGAGAAFEPALIGFLETVVATMIPHNLARAVAAAGRRIDAQQSSADQVRVVKAEPRVGER
jgi:hypothetical protein